MLKLYSKLADKVIAFVIAFIFAITIFPCIPASASSNAIDQMLLVTQQWLNNTYGNDPRFDGPIVEDGITRYTTVYALIRALQIELGIQQTADNFGPTTVSLFNTYYPNGVIQQEYPSTYESNIYGIIQGALWCKGYSTGASSITGHFYDGTGNAIKALKSDMGFINPDSTVTIDIMKALLSMNYYVTVSGGTAQIRQIQQELNRNYPTYIGIIPCDGVYTRSMNKALIIMLQAIEGYDEDDATGNFGNGTKSNLPLDLPALSIQNAQKYHECIKLIQYALCCNGYGSSINLSNTNWNSNLSSVVAQFQSDMNISSTGSMNVDTWMALLLSKGNPDRSCIACDTRFEMTQERINYLKNNGYSVVGRYLTGGNFKQLRADEPARIIDNGLSFFPIFQESGTNLNYFTVARGIQDAQTATNAAKSFSIPYGSIIYFAVDTDPTDNQIQNYILPYFQSLSNSMVEYQIGVYGTRNVCTQVMNCGYAVTCFVSDMSTGYSGNMGFKMPDNWNFDQFAEIQVTTASGTWDLDKVSYCGRFSAVSDLIRVIPPNSDEYLYGNVEFEEDNIGNYFRVRGNKIKYKAVWYCPEGNSEFHYLYVNLQKRNIGTVYQSHLQYGSNNNDVLNVLQTDWIPVEDGGVYRFSYLARNILYNCPINANVTIYISTCYEEE